MKLRDFGLLTDENIDPEVVAFLRQSGFDVWDVCEQGWQGTTDLTLIQQAVADQRVIVTHDSDFGTLAILAGHTIVGILYLRPGHAQAQFTIGSCREVIKAELAVRPPFLIIAKRSGDHVTIRVRLLM